MDELEILDELGVDLEWVCTEEGCDCRSDEQTYQLKRGHGAEDIKTKVTESGLVLPDMTEEELGNYL